MLPLSAVELHSRLVARSLSPTSVLETTLTRLKALAELNMFVTVSAETARQQASLADSRYREGRHRGALDGSLLAVKDNFCTADIRTTCGSLMLDNFTPPYNATVVERSLEAGCVMLGKTNLDEFAMGSGTVDSQAGPCRNIWGGGLAYSLLDPRTGEEVARHSSRSDWRVAGGSSGGSAVAVASGVCQAALGSDTGGSVRIPAAWTGLVSLKPSYGRVSRHGLIPLVNSLDCPGIITRTVTDLGLLLQCVEGEDRLDSTSIKTERRSVAPHTDQSVRSLRVGIPQEYLCDGMTEEVVSAWSQVANLLDSAGAKVVPVSLPHTDLAIPCYSVLNPCEVASNMARYDGIQYGLRGQGGSTEDMFAEGRARGFNDVVRGRILAGNYFLLKRHYEEYYGQALRIRRLVQQDFLKVWQEEVDLLLTPVTLSPPPLYSEFCRVDNRSQTATQDYCTQPANLAGVPALTLPVSLTSSSLPLSVQLLAPWSSDEELLRLAGWLEEKLNFPSLINDISGGAKPLLSRPVEQSSMDHRLIQPASRDQIVAIIRQRAERANRDLPAHLGQALFPAPAFIDFPGREREGRERGDAREAGGDRDQARYNWMEARRREGGGERDRPLYRQAALPGEEETKPRVERLAVVDNVLMYRGDRGLPGLYISGVPISADKPYFEIEISNLEVEGGGSPVIGLCSHRYPLDLLPGWTGESVGYHTADGKLYKGRPRGQPFGPKCNIGDKVGCGVKFDAISKNPGLSAGMVPVFFTKNGKEIGTQLIPSPPGGLFPAIGLQREPEEVILNMESRWLQEEDIAMSIDCGEEDWRRLHDIRLDGQVLEYVGRGKSLIDVGLAQARTPLSTRTHYFEIEIVDPGSSCYIAIGLARKDYPRNRHPGWNKGSIAYHADDGKVFMGSGVGDPFGPRCNKGDIMGCGVLFPKDFECRSDSEEEGELMARIVEDHIQEAEEYETDSGDEEDWWRPEVKIGDKVQVYFTRNGKIIGKKEAVLPKGGFYPTVGMMSSQEKVKVELRPLSG